MNEVNHDTFLTRLRWDTAYGNFTDIVMFGTDCIIYVFGRPLTMWEQMNFTEFLGSSDNMNSLTPVDFCNYFLSRKIPFSLKFKYIWKLNPRENLRYLQIIHLLRREIEKVRHGVV